MVNEINNNKVNLCDSCSQVYPDCTSRPEDVYFGDGVGHDNICACSEYQPSTQPQSTMGQVTDAVQSTKDCISRQAAIDALNKMKIYRPLDSDRYVISDCLNKIVNLPSAQPQRMKGKWIHDGYDIPHGVDWMHCSVCGRREPHVPAAMTNFCPTCGSDMRGE